MTAPDAAMLAALTNSPPAIVAAAPHWASDDPQLTRAFLDQASINRAYPGDTFTHSLIPMGKLGMPTLTIEQSGFEWDPYYDKSLVTQNKKSGTDWGTGSYVVAPGTNGKLYVGPSLINPARIACATLDWEQGKKLGAWGPACKIVKMLDVPSGRLALRDPVVERKGPEWREGDMYYTPKAPNTRDTIRFILGNGAAREVEVIFKIKVGSSSGTRRGAIEDSTAEQLATSLGANDLGAWFRAAELSALLSDAGHSVRGFDDLADSLVGQTTGEGPTAQITLDTTASGHGWYIDLTPLDNTDNYLPTSSPNVWQAKAGSEADGKMDMLSVLLHEYGHALGLEHAAWTSRGLSVMPTAAWR